MPSKEKGRDYIPPQVERIGNKVKVKPPQSELDMAAIFAKKNPTNADVLTVLKALWERG